MSPIPETNDELLTKIECDAIANQIIRSYTELSNAREPTDVTERMETYAVRRQYLIHMPVYDDSS